MYAVLANGVGSVADVAEPVALAVQVNALALKTVPSERTTSYPVAPATGVQVTVTEGGALAPETAVTLAGASSADVGAGKPVVTPTASLQPDTAAPVVVPRTR